MTGAVSVPLVFLAGIISFASPCFLPVVPVFIAYLTGGEKSRAYPQFAGLPRNGFIAEAGGRPAANPLRKAKSVPVRNTSRVRGLANASVFVAAFSAVFVLLWFLTATLGWVVGDYRDVLRIIGGIVLIVLGLVTGGLLDFQWLAQNRGPNIPVGGAPTLGRSALMGFGFGAGWSPCIGPVLGVVLGIAMTSGSTALGTGLLIVYCLGLGLPFLLVAAGATWLTERLGWFSRHYRAVQKTSAALLILLGLLMVTNLLAPLSGFSWLTV